MNGVTQAFAVVAGMFHVLVFVMESLLFRRTAIQRIFQGRSAADASVVLWAFNQGFYNLFLAGGALGGVLAYHAGAQVAGRAVALYACACMIGAGVVLLASNRRMWRGALYQLAAPLVALVAALL